MSIPHHPRRNFIKGAVALGATIALPAIAQDKYPSRPIRLLVP